MHIEMLQHALFQISNVLELESKTLYYVDASHINCTCENLTSKNSHFSVCKYRNWFWPACSTPHGYTEEVKKYCRFIYCQWLSKCGNRGDRHSVTASIVEHPIQIQVLSLRKKKSCLQKRPVLDIMNHLNCKIPYPIKIIRTRDLWD